MMVGMTARGSHGRLFFREFRRTFRTTGAVLPSGRRLGRALARFVRQRPSSMVPGCGVPGTIGEGRRVPACGWRRILEVGPGTGAVTRQIVACMGPEDRLDLVELNDRFVACLREQFCSDPALAAVADRARVLHCPVEQLPPDGTYQVIVSGLPLNNFAVDEVRRIVAVLSQLAAAGGTLSFFEYIAIRRLKALLSGRAERARLRGIGQILAELLGSREIHREPVWANMPPAWVHHVRF
jgi:phospholipid N-methyltransferase